jgi:hypothetical protein
MKTLQSEFKWSSRVRDGWWKTFYYSPGTGFDVGQRMFYGRNEWRTEEQAIQAQVEWERRIGGAE